MEVYAVGNDAAIVIAPLDRDGCLARRSKQAAPGGSRAGCLRAAPPERAGPQRFGQPSPIAGRGVAGNHHVTELITRYTTRWVSAI